MNLSLFNNRAHRINLHQADYFWSWKSVQLKNGSSGFWSPGWMRLNHQRADHQDRRIKGARGKFHPGRTRRKPSLHHPYGDPGTPAQTGRICWRSPFCGRPEWLKRGTKDFEIFSLPKLFSVNLLFPVKINCRTTNL